MMMKAEVGHWNHGKKVIRYVTGQLRILNDLPRDTQMEIFCISVDGDYRQHTYNQKLEASSTSATHELDMIRKQLTV